MKVVSLSAVRSLDAERTHALVGPSPTFTFQMDEGDAEACCSVRLVAAGGDSWLGVVDDKALFTDRVRMGRKPRFIVHHNAHTPTVCGEAVVTLLGRVGAANELPGDLPQSTVDAVRRLLESNPFRGRDEVLVEVRPSAMRIDEGEAPVHGAIPRT